MNRKTIKQEKRQTCRSACRLTTPLLKAAMTLLLVLISTVSAHADTETGDLKVSCSVSSYLTVDNLNNFSFTVTLSDKTITGKYGGMSFTDGVATFSLKGRESKTGQLPLGVEYTVTQTEAPGFEIYMNGEKGTISSSTSEAQFTNTRQPNLEVKAFVESEDYGDYTQEFEFTVTLTDKTINIPYGEMPFTDGVATFSLKHGESITGQLPPGVKYTVTQTEASGYTTTTTGGTGTISNQLSTAEFIITSSTNELSDDTDHGSAKITGFLENLNGWCPGLGVLVKVAPKEGYITKLSLISATITNGETVSEQALYGGGYNTDGEPNPVPTDPADDPNSGLTYSSPRTITLYFEYVNQYNLKIKVSFIKSSLELKSNLENATVTFFDGGTTIPNTINPADFPETKAITRIEDGQDRYIIAHIVPDDDYWTETLYLSAKELQATSTAITPAGARSASVRAKAPSEEDSELNFLVRDVYAPNPNQPTITQPRYDGAAWYWYLLPKEHTVSAGYTSSTINGDIVPKFDLSSDNVSQSGKVVKVTDGTENGWSAEITLDEVSFLFDGSDHGPKITSISIGKEGKTGIVLNGADIIGRHLCINGSTKVISRNPMAISTIPSEDVNTTKNGYFINSCWDESKAGFDITVPFKTDANSTAAKGSSSNPWLISSAAELNLLAKCVNIGQYSFKGEYLKQTANITYDNTTSADFKPIGGSTPFQGNYDGNLQTISGLAITYATDSESDNEPYVGLFGKVGTDDSKASVQNVMLQNCSFSADASINAAIVGGIAGSVENSEIYNCTLTNCTVTGGSSSHVGGIAGIATGSNTLDSNGFINSTVTGGDNSVVGGIAGKLDNGNTSSICKRNLVNGSNEGDVKVIGGNNASVGAIIGTMSGWTLANNKYKYNAEVTRGSTVAKGYTKRGYWNSTKWDDITTNGGAMLYVSKATVPAATTNGSAVTFNKVTKGTDRYDMDGDDFYYAVGQEVTLSVTEGTIKDGSRTLTEELSALTVNDGQSYQDKDILTDKKFNMLEHDATVTPTFTASEWFTVPSNQKKWMTFYHEWKDGNNAAANYTVTDGTGSETPIKVWTITAIDAATGGITKKDLGGVSFSGVPTLFNSDNNLPAVLKFTPPVTSVTAPTDVATQFKGVAAATALSGDNIYVMNGDGEFDHAYLPASDTNTLKANRCYIDLGTNSGARRLFFIEEAVTGIGEVTGVAEVTDHGASLNDKGEMINDKWFTLDGRKLDKLPTKKGLYIYKGKLTVIK